MSGRTDRVLRSAQAALDELDRVAGRSEALAKRSPALSKWSVGQHVEHLAAANRICLLAAKALVEGADERIVGSGAPTLLGRCVLLLGWIPRGRGRAPEATVPESEPDMVQVLAELERGRGVLAELTHDRAAVTTARGRLPHPVLGLFDARDWVRFTAVHVRHHLRIVDGITNG